MQPKGQIATQTLAMPADTNANGDIFGGWLVSQMDLAAGIVAKTRAKSRAVTVAINSMEFLRPVSVGNLLTCYAEIVKTGRTSMTINIEAWSTDPVAQEHYKVTEGVFVYVAIDQHGKSQPIDRDN